MTPEDRIEVISEDRLREAITMSDALEAARRALRAYSDGEVGIVASVLDLDHGDVHIKGAHAAGGRHFAVKIASWVPAQGPRKAVHGGGSLVCDAETGHPVALLLDQHYLSSLRTAAASAVAVDLLARPDSSVAGIVGTGVQARLQLEAMTEVRSISSAFVYGRRREAAEALVDSLRSRLGEVELIIAGSVEELMEHADVIVTTTASTEPLVFADSLRPGQHLCAIGADGDGKAELDAGCFARADRVFVDSLAQSAVTAELGAAIESRAFSPEQIAGEIGAILGGRVTGRAGPEEITIAKMTGIGALDLSIAELALEKCLYGEGQRAAAP